MFLSRKLEVFKIWLRLRNVPIVSYIKEVAAEKHNIHIQGMKSSASQACYCIQPVIVYLDTMIMQPSYYINIATS